VLREQVEAAERYAQLHGGTAAIAEVQANVDTAIRVARERLRLIRQSMTKGQRAMATVEAGPVSEERFLEDELAELKRLRGHLKILLGAVER